jgi:hypothetical protein
MSHFAIHRSALAGVFVFGSCFVAQAQTTTVSTAGIVSTTGIVGVTSTQTARLNVLNLQPVIPGVAAIICAATLEFYDDTGAMLKQLAVTNISPATAANLVFKPTVTSTSPRAQIRAVVVTPSPSVNPGTEPPTPTMPVIRACNVMASLEIIDDATGATHTITTDLRSMPAYSILPLTMGH